LFWSSVHKLKSIFILAGIKGILTVKALSPLHLSPLGSGTGRVSDFSRVILASGEAEIRVPVGSMP
jgi:hypothetical protein